jgi:hypothetical protein
MSMRRAASCFHPRQRRDVPRGGARNERGAGCHAGLDDHGNAPSTARIAGAYSIYGIQKIGLAPAEDGITVDYDATRLRPAEVHAALTRAGIPVAPK